MPKGGVRSPKEDRLCVLCRKQYRPITFWQKYCKNRCYERANRLKYIRPCKKCGILRQVGTAKYKAPLCMSCERDNRSKDVGKRFWKYVKKARGCWKWTGSHQKQGYGLVYRKNGSRLASRISWELHNGPIPKGMLILHKCDNPPCTKPAHLEVGDHRKNLIDAYERGLHKTKRRTTNAITR